MHDSQRASLNQPPPVFDPAANKGVGNRGIKILDKKGNPPFMPGHLVKEMLNQIFGADNWGTLNPRTGGVALDINDPDPDCKGHGASVEILLWTRTRCPDSGVTVWGRPRYGIGIRNGNEKDLTSEGHVAYSALTYAIKAAATDLGPVFGGPALHMPSYGYPANNPQALAQSQDGLPPPAKSWSELTWPDASVFWRPQTEKEAASSFRKVFPEVFVGGSASVMYDDSEDEEQEDASTTPIQQQPVQQAQPQSPPRQQEQTTQPQTQPQQSTGSAWTGPQAGAHLEPDQMPPPEQGAWLKRLYDKQGNTIEVIADCFGGTGTFNVDTGAVARTVAVLMDIKRANNIPDLFTASPERLYNTARDYVAANMRSR